LEPVKSDEESDLSDHEEPVEEKKKPSKEDRIKKIKERLNVLPEDHPVEDRMDPLDEEIDDEFIAKCWLNAQNLPKPFLTKVHKVFAKFPHSEVRDMGKAYMQLYQMLHASEKPTDLTKTQPFANTLELVKQSQALIYLGKKKRHDDPLDHEAKKKEKKDKTDEKEDLNPEKKADQGIIYDQNMALAYLQKKVPHTFGVGCRILTEVKFRLPNFQPKTFLDFGAGLGSGCWAFKDIFQNYEKIVAVEPSAAMRKLGKFLTEDIQNIVWFDTLARIVNSHDLDG
jgi:hypothetical protein